MLFLDKNAFLYKDINEEVKLEHMASSPLLLISFVEIQSIDID